MQLLDLAPEIILVIFRNCSSIADVTSLSRSCRRIHNLLSATQKTLILYRAAEFQFGPLHDILQLLTLNSRQPAHSVRDPARSDPLLRQIVKVGRAAKRWEEIYPLFKWDSDFASRRILSADERYRLRRAIYRHWLYAHAFHNPKYPRTLRRIPQIVSQRTQLLHNWSTKELVEMADFKATMRALISTKVCPSDSMVQAMRHLDGVYLPVPDVKEAIGLAAREYFHTTRDIGCSDRDTRRDLDGCWNGWGDPVTHYYVVEDFLKLDPGAMLWMYDHCQKWQVEDYLDSLGEWFYNNGDTFSETLDCVIKGREIGLIDAEGSLQYGIII
jgi:hypothetical protein